MPPPSAVGERPDGLHDHRLLLPGAISGQDLRARQLADAALCPIPTIVITATEPQPHERQPLQPDGWLDKPFRFDDLLGLIRQYVAPEGPGVQLR